MKNRYTQIENGIVITPENYKKQKRIHKQLQAENASIMAAVRSWRREFRPAPPLLVRLKESAEGIPAGTIIQTSYEMATALIRVRAATPVGDFRVVPDVVITDDDPGRATA